LHPTPAEITSLLWVAVMVMETVPITVTVTVTVQNDSTETATVTENIQVATAMTVIERAKGTVAASRTCAWHLASQICTHRCCLAGMRSHDTP